MSIHSRVPLGALAIVMMSASTAITLPAQICRGTPRHGGVAYEPGKTTYGTSQGGSIALAGGAAIGLSAHSLSVGSSNSGIDAALRFGLVFGHKLQICPGIGLGFERNKWETQAGSSLTSYRATARAGLAAGYDYMVYKGFAIAPFVVVEYTYHGTYFDLHSGDYHPNNTGNTAGEAQAEYGIIAHYKHFYGGRAWDHRLVAGRPFGARWMVGLGF